MAGIVFWHAVLEEAAFHNKAMTIALLRSDNPWSQLGYIAGEPVPLDGCRGLS
jgi:hypothetical protein